jgi:hypothetical protein
MQSALEKGPSWGTWDYFRVPQFRWSPDSLHWFPAVGALSIRAELKSNRCDSTQRIKATAQSKMSRGFALAIF